MTTTQLLVMIAILWALIGVIASIMMGRRGHSSFTWLLLGAVLGPLVVPLGLSAVRAERRHMGGEARAFREGTRGTGTVDVVVGIDGSAQSIAALRAALDLLADRIGRLTLAHVIDFESAWDTERLAVEELERVATSAEVPQAAAVVLLGKPSAALAKYASEQGYELLVVGRRGRGASTALLGSTAMHLGHGSAVPVLVV